MKLLSSKPSKALLTLLLVGFSLFFSSLHNLLQAQPDDEGDGVDVGFTDPPDYGPDFSYIPLPTLEKQTVVLYTTSAQCFIKLKNGNDKKHTPVFYSVNEKNAVLRRFQVPAAGGVLSNLPLNKTISVYSTDSDNNPQKIGEISTARHNQDVIPLDQHLYYPITNWVQEGRKAEGDLYHLVADLPAVHYLEKSHFIQQFFYGGHPLSDKEMGGIPERPLNLSVSECLCRPLNLLVSQSVTPSEEQIWTDTENGIYLPKYKLGQNTIQHFGNNNRGKRWYSYSHDGPAKYQQVWIETRKCVGGNNKMRLDHESTNGAGTAKAPATASDATLTYTFTCIGLEDFKPEDCPCEEKRRVQVHWTYRAQAEISTDLKSGWCKNGRGVWGAATDVVTLMWGYSDQGPENMPLPLNAGQIMVGAGCGMDFNASAAAVNLLQTVLHGYKAITNLGQNIPNSSLPNWAQLYGNRAASFIDTLISGDNMQTAGGCGTLINPGGTLLQGSKRFDLEVNRRLVVSLISNSKLIVEGHGKYQANARILSSYAMSGTIMRSDPDQSGVNCCSNGHGVYSLASYSPGMNTDIAQEWVRSNFIGAGLNNIPGLNLNITGEFGYRGGGARPDCNLVIVSKRASDSPEHSLRENAPKMYTMGNEVWLSSQTEAKDWQFVVLDANGKVVHQKNGVDSGIQLFNVNQASIATGIYFLQFRDNAGLETLKVVKSQ